MRYAVLYFAHFFAYGSYGPYLSLYLGRNVGLSQTEIGWVLALTGVTGLAGPFFWGPFAEKTNRRRPLLIVALLVSAAIYPTYMLAGSMAAALIPTVLIGAVFMPVIPMIDELTMRHVTTKGADYGRIRLWGSLAFIAASLMVGWAMERVDWIQFPVFVAAELVAIIVVLSFPREAVSYQAVENGKDQRFWRALSGMFIVFIIAAFVARVANVGHYVFYSLYLESIGAPDSIKGVAWSLGVVAEIAMMVVAGSIVRRVGAGRLFMLGLLGSAVRFMVYVMWPTVPGALFGQIFHAFSFGALHIGAITLVAELAPEGRSGTGQMAYAALCIGVGTTVGSVIAGYMVDAWGYHGMYVASSVFALFGALLVIPLLRRRTTEVQ
jgi:MFS transporter, PPP family, 3-phenylpropionic acid transporter